MPKRVIEITIEYETEDDEVWMERYLGWLQNDLFSLGRMSKTITPNWIEMEEENGSD